MFTERVLSDIADPELKARVTSKSIGGSSSLQWIKHDIDKFPPPLGGDRKVDVDAPLQQTDLLRQFYLSIAKDGLKYTFENASKFFKPEDLPSSKMNIMEGNVSGTPPHIVIVGAGISGLVAAYELAKTKDYTIEILEMSQRYGGRVKTFTQKDGFDRGLYSDAGAMRIPQPPPQKSKAKDNPYPTDKMRHYLTDYYALDRFGLTPVPFSNANNNAYYVFYGTITKINKWPNTRAQFTKYWPGWDKKIKNTHLEDIKTINDYYSKTTEIVINLLKKRLKDISAADLQAQAEQWDKWTKNWCQFSVGSFLRNTLEGIKSMFKPDDKVQKSDLDPLGEFLPWPESAITAYEVFNYTPGDNLSLATDLQESMGVWWSDDMHSLEGGLSALPEAFAGQGNMEQFITYNRMVTKVVYNWESNQVKSVEVHGVITSSGEQFKVEGRSVILTVPLHVLRGIQIVNKDTSGQPFPKDYQKAIENINYSPSTKIMLQYEKQFWNTDGADITGGFSKTNMPIGQLHYPTNVSNDFTDMPAPPNESGILMVYTWKAEALLWGALTEEQAIMLAVNQVEEIHPRTKDLFQMGKRQAWASDPTTLGAFALLEPRQYISVMYLMQNSWKNVYFAGEAISFANGWIQGALESGLRAAYELYSDDQLYQKIEPAPPVIN